MHIAIIPIKNFGIHEKLYLEMMPSTCLIHKALITFMVGFINYKAFKIINESEEGKMIKPSGDAVLSCFSKIYDNPDIVEEIVEIWNEDV